MREGGLDCPSCEYRFPCLTIFISSTRACERWQEVDFLWSIISLNELIFDSYVCQESLPPIKTPSLLLEGCFWNYTFLVNSWLKDRIQEVISVGRFKMVKLCGVCSGKRHWNEWVNCCVGICVSLDNELEMKLYFPQICCEYSAESFLINCFAIQRATWSSAGWDDLKLVECSQPRALELSVNVSSFCGDVALDIVSCSVMHAAMNSRRLMECMSIMSGGRGNRHTSPSVL